jgi:hypothetical protein
MTVTNAYPVREEWSWEAHYLDGTVLKQEGHKIKDINQDNLFSFHMVNETRPPYIIYWKPGWKLIHFYRMIISHSAEGEGRIRLYCFGYQNGYTKTILVIMPDGGIIVTDDLDSTRMQVHT